MKNQPQRRQLAAVSTGVLMLLAISGCATTPPSEPAPDAAAPSTAASTDLTSRLLTIDDIPTGGWALKPSDASSPETSTDKAETTVCQGDLSAILDAPDDPATVSFERANTTFTEALVPASDPAAMISTIDDAVSACFGQSTKRPLNGATVKIEWEPLATTGVDGTAKGYVLTSTANYVSTSVPLYVVAGDGVLSQTAVVAATGGGVSDEEFAQLTQAAAEAAAQ